METTNFLNGFYNAENPILNKITWEAIFHRRFFFAMTNMFFFSKIATKIIFRFVF